MAIICGKLSGLYTKTNPEEHWKISQASDEQKAVTEGKKRKINRLFECNNDHKHFTEQSQKFRKECQRF